MKLTKDEKYEIEKILDIQAGYITDALNRLCDTSIKFEGLQPIKGEKVHSPLADSILALNESYEKIKKIRAKFEKERKQTRNKINTKEE